MPYIDKDLRKAIDEIFDYDSVFLIKPGVLNYIITRLLLATRPTCYQDYNELVGVLECCKLEFYRRAVSKYEDEKIAENGDVY